MPAAKISLIPTTGPGGGVGLSAGALGCFVFLSAAGGAYAQPRATIQGGPDVTGRFYAWTLTHEHSARMIEIEFPHFMAEFFTPPRGWTHEITNPRGTNGSQGVCTARAKKRLDGIPAGKAASFKLRVGVAGMRSGSGRVIIRFADGLELELMATLPIREPANERNTTLIGLSVILVVAITLSAIRKRRRARVVSDE